jgi:hypothetical protein
MILGDDGLDTHAHTNNRTADDNQPFCYLILLDISSNEMEIDV